MPGGVLKGNTDLKSYKLLGDAISRAMLRALNQLRPPLDMQPLVGRYLGHLDTVYLLGRAGDLPRNASVARQQALQASSLSEKQAARHLGDRIGFRVCY